MRQVAAANKGLNQALKRQQGSRKLGSYKGKKSAVTLWEDRIHTSEGTSYFSEGSVDAAVDTAGNLAVTKRATLARMAAGGVLLGPVGLLAGGMLKKKETHDSRELYLLIETPTFSSLISCDPKDGEQVRKLAAQIKTASRSVTSLKESRERVVREATLRLDHARHNDHALTEASAYLVSVRSDDSAVRAAQERLDAVVANTHRLEAARRAVDSVTSSTAA